VTVESLAKVFGVRSGWDGAPGCCACSSISIQRLVPSGLAPRYEGPTSRYTAAYLRSSGIATRAVKSRISFSENCPVLAATTRLRSRSVDDTDIASGALTKNDYHVLYVTGPNVSAAAQSPAGTPAPIVARLNYLLGYANFNGMQIRACRRSTEPAWVAQSIQLPELLSVHPKFTCHLHVRSCDR
jgi:hypothetical protein